MTSKDYIKVARTLNEQLGVCAATDNEFAADIVAKLAREFADMFAADNPRFVRQTFYYACGLDDEGIPPRG